MFLHVVKPGLCTTLQDGGRFGHQHVGVPVNGPMDALSHAMANLLAGNRLHGNTLEITLQGPTLRFETGCLMALAGADLGATLDGQVLAPGRAVRVQAGAVLQFGRKVRGARAYLAVNGGFDVEPVLGSTSAYRLGAYDGLLGRTLAADDRLRIRTGFRNPPRVCLPFGLRCPVDESLDAPIRVVEGREWTCFSEAARSDLLASAYEITNQADRMGYRLSGAALALDQPLQLPSEAVGFGTIQVPPDGQPIVLMADRQTTGGYPRIAHVISADLPRLAQRLPGERVRFSLISLDEAQQLAVRRATLLARLEEEHA